MQPNPTPYIIWGSMGSAQAMFLFVATQIPPQAHEAWAQYLVIPAIGAAALSVAMSFVPAIVPAPAPTRSIVRWATAETAAILGFLAYMQSGEHLYQYGCAAFGFFAWAYAFPADAASWPRPGDASGPPLG